AIGRQRPLPWINQINPAPLEITNVARRHRSTARSYDGCDLGIELRDRSTFAPTGNSDVGICSCRIGIKGDR
ncbi:MAG: hypothetical protein WEA08_03820, partial [Woeseia sp.]